MKSSGSAAIGYGQIFQFFGTERGSAAVTVADEYKVVRHYTLPIVRQREAELLSRLNGLEASEIRPTIAARREADRLVAELSRFFQDNPGFPAPEIFLTRDGEISFEWQPHRTKSNVVASAQISRTGSSIDFYVGTFLGNRVTDVADMAGTDSRKITTFLHSLLGAIVSDTGKKRG